MAFNALQTLRGYLRGKYADKVKELELSIQQLEKISKKPFEKEKELADQKIELSRLEKEISFNIQKKKLLSDQANGGEELVAEVESPIVAVKETVVVEMKRADRSLLEKKVLRKGRSRGI